MENQDESTRRDSVEIVQVWKFPGVTISRMKSVQVISQTQRDVLEQEILNENIDFLKQNEETFKALKVEDKNELLFSTFCHTNNTEIVKFFIEIVGADVRTLLDTEVAFLQERKEMFKEFEIESKNQLLLEACFHVTNANKGKYLIKCLLENGANVNAIGPIGIYGFNFTPLHAAALGGNFEILKLLIKHKARIDARDEYEGNPLHNTASVKVAKYLIEYNVNIDQQNIYGNTPLMTSLIRCIPELSLFLIDKGANVEGKSQNIENSSPLHLAVANGNIEIVKNLIKHKAKLDPKNTKGQTAFDIALEKNHQEIISFVIEAESDAAERENIGKEKKNINTNAKCIICFNPRNGIFTFNPCGHSVACEYCCKRIVYGSSGDSKKCPYCRKPISNYLKVFFQTMTPSPVVTAKQVRKSSTMIEKSSNNGNKIAINLAKSINLLEIDSNSNDDAVTSDATSTESTTQSTQSTRSNQSTPATPLTASTFATSTIPSTLVTTNTSAVATLTSATTISTIRNRRELQNLNQTNVIEGKRTRTRRL